MSIEDKDGDLSLFAEIGQTSSSPTAEPVANPEEDQEQREWLSVLNDLLFEPL